MTLGQWSLRSRPARALVVLAGAVLGGGVAALASALLPAPYPMAVGIAVAVPVMDVGLYPGNVPDDRRTAATVGAFAALGGIAVGVVVGWLTGTLDVPVRSGLTVGFAFLGAEYAGRYVLSRSSDGPRAA